MKESEISIIMVVFYTTDILFESLESCKNMNGIKEVVVVNNGNPDYVVEKLRKMHNDGEIKLLDGHGNLGFARSCNIGALHATGKYLMFMNPDCYTKDQDYALKLKEVLENNPEYWFATSLILNSDGTIQKTCRRNLMTPLNALSQSFGLGRLGLPEINRDINEIKDLPRISDLEAFSGALFFTTKERYNQVGGLSEDYFLHVEDMDLCRKIYNAGGKICFVKDVSIHHKLSTSQVTSKFLEWHKARGFIHYLQKFFTCCRYPIIKQLLKAAIWARYYLKIALK